MSKLNKLVTNYPVALNEQEVANLSSTLAPVVAACGGGGGGGTPIYYYGDDVNINISPSRVIRLTDAATAKLNRDIPTKVSDLSDSANYQTVAGMDEYLTTGDAQTLYQTKDNMSAYLTSANAASTYQTKDDMSAYATREWTTKGFISESDLYGVLQNYVDYPALNTRLLDKQDKLTFDYDNDKISAINGSALAGQGGKTYSAGAGIAIVDEYISLSADYIQAITQVSGKENKLEFTYDNSGSIIKINNSAIAGGAGGGSVSYTGRNGVEINGNYIELETAAKNAIDSVAGISTDVGTLKTASANWNEVSAKLDSSLASTTYQTKSDMANYLTTSDAATRYQPIGNYATKTDINDMATQTWVGQQGYLTSVPDTYALKTDLNTASSTLTGVDNELSGYIDYVSSHAITSLDNYYTKTQVDSTFASATQLNDYLTTAKYHTDSGTFALKTETSSKTEITNALTAKVDKPTSTQTGKLVYDGDTSAWVTLPAGTTTIVQGQGSVTANYDSSNSTYTVSLLASAENALTSVASKVDKPTSLNNKYLVLRTDNAGNVSGWDDFNNNVYSKSEADGRYQKKEDMGSYLTTAQYETDSATFYTTSNPAGYLTKTVADTYYQPTGYYATSAGLTAGNQYAMTTTGWAKVSTPTIPDITANNGISANGHTIGIDNTNLVTNTQYAWTTTGWSDIGLSNYLPLSGGTVTGDVIVKSTGTNLLAVNTTATLMGQSRVNNLTDTTALGTNWLGVNSNGGGFLKNVQGGNVGALNGTSIQIDFAPNGNTAYGNITVNSQDNISKVVHIPTASYNSMSSFNNTNGPNYMLRKTASGFDIGAAVINVTQLPAQTEANTYYFIYET